MKEEVAFNLKQSADKLGVISVLAKRYRRVDVHVPMTLKLWESSLENLQLSTRSGHGLLRSGAHTVGDVAELIMSEEGLGRIRNVGKKSVSEIKLAMLQLTYQELTEWEKLNFWRYAEEHNEIKP